MVNIPVEVIDILFKIGNQKEDTIDDVFRGNGESRENNPQELNNGPVKGRKRTSRNTRRRQARK